MESGLFLPMNPGAKLIGMRDMAFAQHRTLDFMLSKGHAWLSQKFCPRIHRKETPNSMTCPWCISLKTLGNLRGSGWGIPNPSSQLIFRTNPSSQLSVFLTIPVTFRPIRKSQQILGKESQLPVIFWGQSQLPFNGHLDPHLHIESSCNIFLRPGSTLKSLCMGGPMLPAPFKNSLKAPGFLNEPPHGVSQNIQGARSRMWKSPGGREQRN